MLQSECHIISMCHDLLFFEFSPIIQDILKGRKLDLANELKFVNPCACSLEGLMPKLKLQYFDHLMQRTDSLEKTLMLGQSEGRRIRG